MSTPGLVVVGASLAGLRAVEAARRGGFTGAVTLIGAEPHLPYDRPPLSKRFLTGEVGPTYFRQGASLRAELDVDVRLGMHATALDTVKQVVTTGDNEIGYAALVIATGAKARELPGRSDLAGVHTLRTLDDAVVLRKELVPGSRVVIIGAGFIGSEVACAAHKRGAQVTVIEAELVPLVRAVGGVMGAACAKLHERNGIELRCGVAVESLGGAVRVESVRLSDGSTLPADVVVVGIGAEPVTGWLAGSGLELDNGVVCDEKLAAGTPGVYAAGDVARWFNPLFGETMRLEHWTTAAEQGGLAARNALDPERAMPCATVPYFWSDWNDDRIQFVGVSGDADVEVVAGDHENGDFLALYRRDDQLCGALGLNQRRPISRLRQMLANRIAWSEAVDFARAAR